MPVNRRKFLKRTAASAVGAVAVAQHASEPALAAQVVAARRTAGKAKRKVLTDRAPKPVGPYSQAIIAGNTIYVAGQVPNDPRTGQIVAGGFEEQAAQVFENIKAIVEAAGVSLANVVKVNVYLANLADFAKMNEVYRRYFSPDYPVRTTVGAQLLGQFLIEVDCIAVRG